MQYFFDHAAKAADEGKPLRFHFQTSCGKSFIYGMIICEDLQEHPKGRYVVFVPRPDAAKQIANELGAFNLQVAVMDESELGVVDESMPVLVVTYQAAGRLAGRDFRVKLIDEAHHIWSPSPEQQLSSEIITHIRKSVTAKMTADFTTTFDDNKDNGPRQQAKNSWLGLLGNPYSLLWKSIIRPPRAAYSAKELGLTKFLFRKNVYERKDLQLTSPRGQKLECSHFFMRGGAALRQLCVVYLHGNCSSRLEVFDVLPVLLSRGLAVFCLDLSGSGWSDGEYISLGHYEEQDLKCVLDYLRESGQTRAVGLWGRSMGAAAAVLRASDDGNLAACVLDSPFSDLKVVIEEYVNRRYLSLPTWMMSAGLELLRSEVESRAEFNPLELSPVRRAGKATCPALFGVAADDSFILPHHTQDLHNAWGGERELRHFTGGHGGKRPRWFLEEASDFLLDQLTNWSDTTQHRGADRRRAYAV